MSALHISTLVALSFGTVSSEETSFVRVDKANAVPEGTLTTQKTLESCEATCVDSCLQYSWNKKSKHCYTSSSTEWSPIDSDHIESGCLPDQVAGCPAGPAPSPAPTPTPTPPPAPTPPPTPTPPLPSITHQQLLAPSPLGSASQAAAMKGVYYFLPPAGSSAFITLDASTGTWGTLEIDADSGVLSMLKGASLAAVPASVPGLDDFLVVSGGGTKHVKALNMRTQTWQSMADMHNSQEKSCSVGCLGYWMSMTGDMKGEEEKESLSSSKPANRQEYRYNLTSGEHFEVNGEKERGGAGCGCDESANSGSGRAFWAGGYSNSAITNQIEMWSVNPNKRGGQPIFKMSESRRDVGATVCGGRFIVAGGVNGKTKYSSVDVFNSSSTTDGDRVTYEMGVALKSPQVSCVAGRVALISAGGTAQVFGLDTVALPAAGAQLATLPLPLGGSTAAASAADLQTGTAIFFDGQHADLFSLASLSDSIMV